MTSRKGYRPTRFGVVGAGPVGCILAAFLAKGGNDVTLCDVQPALTAPAVNEGIVIEHAENLTQKVTRVCEHVDELADFEPEVIFLTVKAYALRLIASALETFHHEGLHLVSWQNGIDTELELANILGRGEIFRAVVNYGCGLKAPGVVYMPFHHPPHFIQELDPQKADIAKGIAEVLTDCGLTTEPTQEIVSMVWRKSIMNACMNPVCAVTGMTMSQVMNDPIVLQTVDALVKESVRVARANEISLGWDFYPYCMEYMKGAGDHKPSMLMDVEMGRRTEIDFINGKIVEYGLRAGVETPFNSTMRSLLKGVESRMRRQSQGN